MEKEIKIKTKDNFFIYGSLNKANKTSSKLVIFVHGFTGNRNEHIFFNGAKYFTEKGFDTFRFDFYNDSKKARHFENTKISQHGSDITTVINYFKNKYKKIYLAGHSFGGTSLLFADTKNVNAFVFWDASYVVPEEEKKAFPYDKKIKGYFTEWGIKIIVGKDFVNELFNFPDCGKLISQIHIPVKFIGAGKSNIKDSRKYFVKANSPKALVNINNAGHNFNTLETEQKLFDETYSWFKKY